MLKMGVIEKASGPWASPIVLVKKKDGSTRFCIDYRKLNDITVKDSHPLPRIDDTLDTLSGASWFSTLDLKTEYWQVDVAEKDRQKTAFVTGYGGFWQFKVMPFGLCNTPATSERLMEEVLTGLTWKLCLVYLDDVVVFANTFEQELDYLLQVLDRVRSAGLKLSPKKCHQFRRKVHFLGHLISGEGIETDPEKVSAFRDWPTPRCLKEVRSFLGMSSYYRRFIKSFSTIARPLHQLMESGHVFEWTDACESAFQELKSKMVTAPILAHPYRDTSFILDTDASDTGVGAVLSQVQDNHERVIAYFSKSLSKPERSYCVTIRELLALCEQITGHFVGLRTSGARKASLLVVSSFCPNMTSQSSIGGGGVIYADALSRRPCAGTPCSYCDKADARYAVHDGACNIAALRQAGSSDSSNLDVSAQADSFEDQGNGAISLDRLKNLQLKDKVLSVVVGWKESGQRPLWEDISSCSPAVKHFWSRWDGVLYRRFENVGGLSYEWQIVLPEVLRKSVLRELHNSETAGYLGIAKTFGKVRARYYWCGLRRDVEHWCRACDVCARRKRPPKSPKAPLQQYVVGAPLERIAVDVMGPLPVTHLGNRYLLVVGDYFTKWCDAYPIPDQEADKVAEVLVNGFVPQFGVPRQLHSDQGRNFEGFVLKEMCNILVIDKTRTTPLHPQSDGMDERLNQTLESMLSMFVDDNQRDWDVHVPLLMMAYRSSIHDSTGVSPCTMMFGREITLPVDLMFGGPESDSPVLKSSYAHDLASRLEHIHDFARDKLAFAHGAMKKNYDHNAKSARYEVGEAVWLRNLVRKKGLSPKLQLPWTGLFIVTKRLTDVTYQIQQTHRSKPRIVHFNRLKPYNGDEKPTWFDDSMARRNDSVVVSLPETSAVEEYSLSLSSVHEANASGTDTESEPEDSNPKSLDCDASDASSTAPSSVSGSHNIVSRRGRRIVKPGWHRDFDMQS
ncbi:uncharacterized protein LOC132564610 [Ylistrum balloti]|uniref:uncharacterized protein LOC132564610 n=1 Tax=Ylistrum balloti TaxID=509963 RepID=UPI002905E9A9|nr:uncharacterized protein LOC132564610 [Ylistrum balloti]